MMIDLAQESLAEDAADAPRPDQGDIKEAEEMIRQGVEAAETENAARSPEKI